MSDHEGLPNPFYDHTGFPLCLLPVREEIVARGGTISGGGMRWTVSHPRPNLPDIEIEFDHDGELLIRSEGISAEWFCQEKWWEPSQMWQHEHHRQYGAANSGDKSSWRQKLSSMIIYHIAEVIKNRRKLSEYLASNPPSTIHEVIRGFLNGEVNEGSDLEGRRVEHTYPAWPPA